ncbi:MAG TPA: hypothetical protein VMW47_08830 [Verrucomicrobiae bacterium]|nr:hypothetical protein [Verrucomicrobiae bacterium]
MIALGVAVAAGLVAGLMAGAVIIGAVIAVGSATLWWRVHRPRPWRKAR